MSNKRARVIGMGKDIFKDDDDLEQDHPLDSFITDESRIIKLSLDQIITDPEQPRKFFDPDSLAELSLSIQQKGVLQPVLIRRDQEGKIYLVAGERRLRAAKLAGLEKIPAIITKGNPLEIAIIENLQRDNLKPIEEAEALGRMIEQYNYTQEQLALVIGKAQSTISETISLNKLPDNIKNEARSNGKYARRTLVEIAKKETPEEMIYLFNLVKEDNLTSGQLREITRKRRKSLQRTSAVIALEKTNNLETYLAKLDLGAIEDSEKIQLITNLERLKSSIERIIN